MGKEVCTHREAGFHFIFFYYKKYTNILTISVGFFSARKSIGTLCLGKLYKIMESYIKCTRNAQAAKLEMIKGTV